MIIHKQEWSSCTRYLIVHKHGSVQLELYSEKQKFGGTAYIWALWVEEAHRREGIATQLITLAEDLAKQEGHDAVYLEWNKADSSYEIFDWYERRGYDEKEFGDGYSLMRKEL